MNNFSILIALTKSAWENARKYLVITTINNALSAFVPLISIVGLGSVVNALINKYTLSHILMLILGYLSLNLIIALINQVLTLLNNNEMRKLSNVIQISFMQDIVDIDYHYAQDGTLANLRRKSMQAYPVFFISTWGECIHFFIQLVGAITAFALMTPIFVIILLFLSITLILLNLYIQRKDFEFNNEKVEDDRKLDYLYEVMTSYKFAKEIRINNASNFIQNKFQTIFHIQVNNLKKLMNKKLFVNLLSVLLSIFQSAAMYLFFTYQVSTHQIGIAEYTILLASTTLLSSALISLFSKIGTVNSSIKAYSFLTEYKQIINDNNVILKSNQLNTQTVDYPNATIRFENVSFCYPKASSNALENINLEIPCHQKLGIVGLNGSGKTTMVKLLLRLYIPSQGKITLNGIDITKIPFNDYIQHIGVVLQDYTLFAYSLKENIVFNECTAENKLKSSIENAGLKRKIENLSQGINTAIGRELDDNGVEFSGGEGQKVAVARSNYRNSDILILDEPTSALDPIAEYDLFSRLNKIAQNRTTIFITHRLSSTQFCDHLIVLSNGRIVEQGNHLQLMKQNAEYAKLFNYQAKYYSRMEL
ncbi:MAG: ABC transporter ATP-binding protein/permease [Clostridiales bacterium]|jgi:ATP-binding cassette subfamily B protein/ATP-binding cassette subfamily C protein|nr:ABC transporter ATP-binding protein/permease [Clostridiales bacterium]